MSYEHCLFELPTKMPNDNASFNKHENSKRCRANYGNKDVPIHYLPGENHE